MNEDVLNMDNVISLDDIRETYPATLSTERLTNTYDGLTNWLTIETEEIDYA